MSFRRRRGFMSFLNFMGNINSDSYEDSYMDGERSSFEDDDSYAGDPWDGYPRGDHSPSHSNGVNLTLNEEPDSKPTVMSLFDLAARVTAKHISCEEMEQHQPPLDETMLKRVAFWASPQDKDQVKAFADLTLRGDNSWNVGERIFKESKVQDMRQVGFMVTAVVTGNSFRGVVESTKVSFTFEKQHITSSACEGCPKKIWCSHLIAAIFHRIKHANMIPIHAPVTETLSTLNREQLQKLIQYAINEDPGGVLGKVFRRVDQIRDVMSEINETAGAPDPTFGLGLEGKSTWDLSMDELKESFKSACYRAVYDFPSSYQESTIESSSFYSNYLQRVVDFVHKDEIDAAGRVLIVLATVAANETSSSTATKKYQRFLKTIERMCSLYILQFTGEARSDLIILCQDLNKKFTVNSTQSNWAELPSISSLFQQESMEAPGVLGAKQTSLFYEPLCVSVAPDPSQDFYYVVTGTVEPPDSVYDEPLPLMMLRFEAIRQWKRPERGENELLRLGAVILRKLLRMTYQLSILREQDRVKKAKETKKEKSKKRKAVDEAGDAPKAEPPAKKQKVAAPRRSARLSKGTPSSSPINLPSTSTAGGPKCVGAVARRIESLFSKADVVDSKPDDESKTGDEADKLMESEKMLEFETNVPAEPEEGSAPAGLNMALNMAVDCLGNGKEDGLESLPKETLAFCLLHMCRCIYKIKNFDSFMKGEDNEVLASATLRALELARFRTVAENGRDISTEEHSALNYLEQRLVDSYQENKDKMLTRSFSFLLHRLYMKMLCECNNDGVCFFDRGMPLVLISFLVKNTLRHDLGPDNKHKARCLCWYTLCHSYKPLRIYTIPQAGDMYYEYKGVFNQLEKCFQDIVSTFLSHLRGYPAKASWLLKLLKHYEKVKDGKALYYLWSELRDFPYGLESEEVQVALVKFLLNCIKRHNNRKANFGNGQATTLSMLDNLCKKLGTKFTEIVLVSWEEMIKFFRSGQLNSLVDTMKDVHTLEKPLSKDMVDVVMDFFSGKFQHDVDSCQLLIFFNPGDENYTKAVGLIRENAANFTPAALLHVAQKQMDHPSETEQVPLGNIFSTEVELFINCALHRIGMENKSNDFYISDRNLLYGTPNSDVQWVFKAFLEKPADVVAKSRQFFDVLNLMQETFSNDLQTILSLFSSIESKEPLLEKCKLRFGERIVQLVNKSLFEVLNHINHNSYGRILQQLETVQEYYVKYVNDGPNAFKLMLSNMKRVYKTKRKLITMMNSFFPSIMKEL